jgi:CheY-like chemotaxis protein
MSGPKKRILYAEDDVAFRRPLASVLRHVGYDVIEVSNGQEGIGEFHKALKTRKPFDLVLTDRKMADQTGEGDGFRLMKEVRAGDPEVPIIMMTSTPTPIEEVTKAGGTSFIDKGAMSLSAILKIIERTLADRERDLPGH